MLTGSEKPNFPELGSSKREALFHNSFEYNISIDLIKNLVRFFVTC